MSLSVRVFLVFVAVERERAAEVAGARSRRIGVEVVEVEEVAVESFFFSRSKFKEA